MGSTQRAEVRMGTLGPLVFVLAVVGCGTFQGFQDEADQIERIREVTAELEAIGEFPSADRMAATVELVTFEYRREGSTEPQRDTLRGRAAVTTWLEGWYVRQLPDTEFRLTPREALVCDGAAIQTGTYPVRPRAGEAVVRQQYRARWVEGRRGEWELAQLWLDPDARARVSRIGTGCTSVRDVRLGMHRWVVTAEMVASGEATGTEVGEAMRDAGWTAASDYEGEFPKVRGGGVTPAVSVGYRLTPAWSVEALWLEDSGHEVHGRLVVNNRISQPTLTVSPTRVIGILGVRRLGLLAAGIGPAFVSTDFDWVENSGSITAEPVSGSSSMAGVVAQLSAMVPISPLFRGYVSARYVAAGAAEVPGYGSLAPLEVPIGGLSGGLGLALTF